MKYSYFNVGILEKCDFFQNFRRVAAACTLVQAEHLNFFKVTMLYPCEQGNVMVWGASRTTSRTWDFRTVVLMESSAISHTVRRNIREGLYEREEIDIVLANVSAEDRVLELGASFGGLSCVVMKEKNPAAYVCVEANPYMVTLLCKNHELNNVQATAVISGVVTPDPVNGERDFYIHRDCWGSSLTPCATAVACIRVRTQPLEELLAQYRPTFLICDIEGGEYELFSGACALDTVQRVCIELHGDNRAQRVQLLAFLQQQGFVEDERYRKHPLFGDVFFFQKLA